MQYAKRTNWDLHSNELSRIYESLKSSNTPVIDLSASNPTVLGFKYPDKKIIKALQSKENLKYAPSSKGMRTARLAVCEYYKSKGYEINPEHVFLTSSTSEGYSFLFRLLANEGESILFPKPSYPLFQYLVDLNDVSMSHYQLNYETAWHIDIDSILHNVEGKTKAVVFVNPNNPTGSFLSHDELNSINKTINGKNIAIISDEVFLDYSFDGSKHPSFVQNKENLTFVLGGISKVLALPQMKISWIVVSGPLNEVREAVSRLEVITDTYLSVNTPSQNALLQWFEYKKTIQEEILSRIKTNFVATKKLIEKNKSIECLNTQGGWYVILKFPKVFSEEEITLKLLRDHHIFVHPGYFFDFVSEPFLVLSLLPKFKDFKKGLYNIIQVYTKITSVK